MKMAAGQVQSWDVAAGRISEMGGASAEKNAVRVPLELGPYESKFIAAGAASCIIPSGDPK